MLERTDGEIATADRASPVRAAFAELSRLLAEPSSARARLAALAALEASWSHDGALLGASDYTSAGHPAQRLQRALAEARGLLERQLDLEARHAAAHARLDEVLLALAANTDAHTNPPTTAAAAAAWSLWHLPVGLIVTDTDQRVRLINPAAARLLGVTVHDALGARWTSAFAIIDRTHLGRVRSHFAARGAYRGLLTTTSPSLGTAHIAIDAAPTTVPEGWVRVLVWDATTQVAERTWLDWLATHDTLTGLLDRAGLTVVTKSWGERLLPGMVWLDVVGIHAINRAFGHHVGDGVLRAVADRILAELDADDVVARVSSDEFVILTAAGTNPLSLRRRLARTLTDAPLMIADHQISVGIRLAATTRLSQLGARPRDAHDLIWREIARLERATRSATAAAQGSKRDAARPHQRTDGAVPVAVPKLTSFVDVVSGQVAGYELSLVDELGYDLRERARHLHAEALFDAQLIRRAAALRAQHPYVALRTLQLSEAMITALTSDADAGRLQLTLTLAELESWSAVAAQGAHAAEARRRGLRIGLDLSGTRGGELAAIALLNPHQLVIQLRTRNHGNAPIDTTTGRLLVGLADFASRLGCELAATFARIDDLELLRAIALESGATIVAAFLDPGAPTNQS